MRIEAFASGVDAFRGLLTDDVIAERWSEPSVLDGYTIGGLVGHVCIATSWVDTALKTPAPTGVSVLSLGEWFQGMVPTQRDMRTAPVHEAVRREAHSLAERGTSAVTATFDRLTTRVLELAGAEDSDRLVSLQPIRPDAMTLADLLRTRLLELVVHADDLAVSVGREPAMPAAALDDCLALLMTVARFRHGDAGVLRVMARAERAPASVFPVI